MDQNNITFREIQSSDYSSLSKIISRTWNYEKFCTPKTAKHLSTLYLKSCLTHQTFTCVALNNNKPVGIIMGNIEKSHHTPLKYLLGQMGAFLSMLITTEGRKVLKMFSGFSDINKNLLSESNKTFEGELAFFAVDENQRGTGIGKTLFTNFLKYMHSNGINSFYLFTDNSCNYGFYEKQGLTRLGEKSYSLKPYKHEDMHFFIYQQV